MQGWATLHVNDYEVLVDMCDLHLLNGRAWRVCEPNKKPYLKWTTSRKGKRVTVTFHRLITQAKPDEYVDHINGNSLDNRRANLRIVDSVQNAWNSANKRNSKSRFRGVGWSTNAWQVSIRDGKKQHYIGRFKDEIEAAYHYDLASLKYHGEFGRRNFLPLVTD